MIVTRSRLFTRWSLLLILTLSTLLAACGVDSDTVEKVDDAVKLIQDVDRDNTWNYLTDGLDALAEQDGYIATIGYQISEVDDGDLIIQYTEDADGDVRIDVTDPQSTQSYYSPALGDDADTRLVFQMNADDYACPTAADTQRYAEGIASIFAFYDLRDVLTSTLSVAELDGDSTLLDRDAGHYVLEARLPDALDILERTGDDALRERIDATAQGTITGTFDLDDETGALLFFDSVYVYDDLAHGLLFRVTQWGDVPDIAFDSELPVCN